MKYVFRVNVDASLLFHSIPGGNAFYVYDSSIKLSRQSSE